MKNKSQKEWVVKQLLDKGKISRNFALKNFVSRLSALILDLRKEGWDFETEFIDSPKPDGSKGKNFVYKMIKTPYRIKTYQVGDKIIRKIVK